jgi:hypothetical protein
MDTRLDGILTTLAQQYANSLLQAAPRDERRIHYLADGLANYGLLVMTADIPTNAYDFLTRTWVENYRQLYLAFTGTVFPLTGGNINISLVDQLRPPIAVLHAESTAVTQVLAGYIVPYVAMRQEKGNSSEAEIRGLMAYILDALEASDLEHDKYNRLTLEGARIIKQLITLPVRQYALTTMKKPLFQQTHVEPQTMPERKPQPAPPTTLPETGSLDPSRLEQRKPKKTDTKSLPSWYNSSLKRGDTGRLPPVPLLPEDDD